jgi:hypothetical protein
MDDIREMLELPYHRDAEEFALKIQDAAVLGALAKGLDVVVDNTHLHDKWPRRIATLIWESGYSVDYRLVHLDVDQNICSERNTVRRQNADARASVAVPEGVIEKQGRNWAKECARPNGPWTIESITQFLPEIVPVASPEERAARGLPVAVACDLDGTLAEHNGRSPYDVHLCASDILVPHIADILCAMRHDGHRIIFCSGRSEKYRALTEQWLADNGMAIYDELLMRPDGDERRDSIIKLELHDKHIRDQYNVLCVLDDRDRVINTWRNLGYPCLQVAPGDF